MQNLNKSSAALELLSRRKARASLIGFTEYTFPAFQAATHHKVIAEALESVERGDCKRLMIFAPPRHTKSELSSRRFPAWFIGRNPAKQIICSTYAQEFADDFGRDVREIVRCAEYKRLFEGVALSEDSQAKNKWRTTANGIYVSVGVDGPLTGRGAHLALIDDPFKSRKEAESETVRNNVWHWYTSVLRTRLMPGGAIVLIMTRWHEDDLAGRLLKEMDDGGEQWKVVSLPAVTQGEALWPEWFPMTELASIERTLGPRDWASLYMQNPTPDDGEYFKAEWWLEYSSVPTSLNTYISGDFAVTEGDGDFTSLIVWGVDHAGQVFALDRWTGQKAADTWIFELVRMMERWKPIAFIGEGGPIRRAVEPFLKRVMGERNMFTQVEWLTSGGDKASNARSFQAMMSCRRVFWPATSWAEAVKAQLLKFPGGKHDDDVDACGLFGRYISDVWAANRPNDPPKAINWDAPLKMGDMFKRKRA